MPLLASILASGVSAAQSIDFNRDVRPILSDKCFHCHGPDSHSREAGLRLDIEQAAKEDRGDATTIVEGAPDRSELMRRIESTDEWELMPPPETGKKLESKEIDILRRWIAQGADWSAAWTYQKPVRGTPPPSSGNGWETNWIDHYVLQAMEKHGFSPSDEADKVTLLRRLSFDLTGLPPSPEDIDYFLNDNSPGAYKSLVDRLLESPRYGERMAMYWLDLVRYADTVGYHGDQNHHASPYRDWVIHSFNENMTFDDFTTAQLAGDFLPGDDQNNLIASGYNRLLQTNHEGGVQVKEYTAIYAADRVNNLSAVWMAATMGCCQCHDHKFDPLTTKEFYSLAAFFADIDDTHHLTHIVNREYTLRRPEIILLNSEQEERIKALKAEAFELDEMADEQAVDEQKSRVSETEQRLKEIQEQIKAIESSARRMMITRKTTPRTTRVLPRGNWLDETGEVVTPQTPAALGLIDVGERRANRLDLAHWLCDEQDGAGSLTSRVMVNRFWALLFGDGLARNLEDFGAQGEAPSHPKLLDALAIEYVESGWDTKHMLRTIVLSSAYRQSSNIQRRHMDEDPLNHWLSRQARFRLPAEMVRDNALAVSGLLVHDLGGPSVRPYQPKGHFRHLNFPKRVYTAHTDDRQWRRGLYVHWQRQFLHPMLAAFDAPNREACTAKRPRSNTPLAALTLMNDPTFVEAARGLATATLIENTSTDISGINSAFRSATSRLPNRDESERLAECLETNRIYFSAHPSDAEALLSIGVSPVDSSVEQTELAAWTSMCRVLLNLSEVNVRN